VAVGLSASVAGTGLHNALRAVTPLRTDSDAVLGINAPITRPAAYRMHRMLPIAAYDALSLRPGR